MARRPRSQPATGSTNHTVQFSVWDSFQAPAANTASYTFNINRRPLSEVSPVLTT